MKGTAAVPGRGFVHQVTETGRTSKPFLELMAGTCRLANAVAERGVPAESFEITRSVVEDIMSTANTSSIRNRIKRRRVSGIWIGITCASWSRARRGNPNKRGFPPPLRDDTVQGIWGLVNVSDKDQDRIWLGNKLALWTASIIRLAIRHRVPITIENPMTSRLWIFPPIAKEVSRATSVITFDACQYGTPWKKSTKLASWNIDLSPLEKRCHRSANWCSATGVPHVKLEGVDDKGEFWTAKASPYPLPFCRAYAHLLSKDVITQSP